MAHGDDEARQVAARLERYYVATATLGLATGEGFYK